MTSSFNMFHASDHLFKTPSYELLCVNRKNGLLGLWVSHKQDWVKPFGKHVYRVGFAGKSVRLSVDKLCTMSSGSSEEFFKQKRLELLSRGITYIRIVE